MTRRQANGDGPGGAIEGENDPTPVDLALAHADTLPVRQERTEIVTGLLEVRFDVPGIPVAVNQAYQPVRWGARSGLAMTREGKAYKQAIAIAGRNALVGMPGGHRALYPLEGDLEVSILFHFPTLASDVDGPVKLVLDAMQVVMVRHRKTGTVETGAGIYHNDRQVRCCMSKCGKSASSPRTEIAVRPRAYGPITHW